MNHFTLMSFELDIAQKFFRDRDNQPIDFSGFNVFSYFFYLVYKAGSLCGFCKEWKSMRKKVECKEEMLKQLDVKLLLQRFNYLERAVEILLLKKGEVGEEIYKPETISILKKRRRKYRQLKKRVRAKLESVYI